MPPPDPCARSRNLRNLRCEQALYVGVGGNISVIMKNIDGTAGNAVVFKNAVEGTFLPVIVDYVLATGTTATDLVAVY